MAKEEPLEWPKVVGPTAMSSTTETKLGGANLKIPANARYIKEIVPQSIAVGGNTATEPITVAIILKGDSMPIMPYEVLCEPIGSSLGASGVQSKERDMAWPVNCPVKGGSELQVYGKGLFNHTIEPYVLCTVVFTNYRPGPQMHAKLGTFTNTGTSAGEAKGSGIRLEGGKVIREVFGLVVGTTVAASKGFVGKFRLSSSGLKGMGDIEVACEGVPGTLSVDAAGTASNQEDARLTRQRCYCPITDPVDIDDYHNLGVDVTTTGNFIIGCLYQKAPVR